MKMLALMLFLLSLNGMSQTGQELYARLNINIDDAGNTTISDARIIAGAFVSAQRIAGDHLIEVTYRGETIALDTFDVALSNRGFSPDGGEIEDHSYSAVSETTVQVRFPVGSWYGDSNLTDLLEVGIYRFDQGIPDATLLPPARLQAAYPRALSQIYQSNYGDLTASLEIARRIRDNDLQADNHLDWEENLTYGSRTGNTVTPLLLTGSTGSKKNLVIIGDGFAAADQNDYNQLVENLVMNGAFGTDVFNETKNAFNIYRINAISNESGVSTGEHCIWQSNKVSNPTQNNLRKGTFSISIDLGEGALHYITAGATSLKKIGDEFKAFSVLRTNSCGEDVINTVKVRMIETTEDLDMDGTAEPVGQLKIFAPKGLPGPEGNFTISISQTGNSGAEVSFTKTQDGTIDIKDTAMDYLHNGLWDHCWLQGQCSSKAKRDALLALVPDATYGIIILNTDGGGGCGGNGFQHFTKASGVGTVIHEMGHGIGGLGDEYNQSRTHTGDEPSSPNLTKDTNLATIKWANFINPATPLPTLSSDVADLNQDVGAFEGGGTYSKDIYRPAHTCRMRASSNNYCPVCYHHIRELLYPFQELSFNKTFSGDFNGDGKDDIVIQSGESLELHLSESDRLTLAWNACPQVDNTWSLRSSNSVYVGDFNGDGMDDLLLRSSTFIGNGNLALAISNGTGFDINWVHNGSVGTWPLKIGDRPMVGDFDGDGMDDIYIYNGYNHTYPRMGLLRSTGIMLEEVAQHERFINGWLLAKDARILVGDLNGDGLADIYSHSPDANRMRLWRSNGVDLQYERSYYGSFSTDPGVTAAKIQDNDVYHLADFNNDGKDDLYMINTTEEALGRLVMLRSDGSFLITMRNYNNVITGWDIANGDALYVADLDGDQRDDLYLYNGMVPGSETIGMVRSNGTGLDGANKQVNWINGWNIGPTDQMVVGNFNGGAGWDDLFVHNTTWFGMMRGRRTNLSLDRLYHYYLHNFNYYGPLGHN